MQNFVCRMFSACDTVGSVEEKKQIKAVEELKAVAHPLRVQMLGSLREHGPATATELAKRFATDTGSTSYHLRKLAGFGFVEEIEDPGGHPRSRRWQAAHRYTSWSNTEMAATAEGREVSGFMRLRQVEVLGRDVERFNEMVTELPAEWVDACGIGDMIATLTWQSVNELWERFYADVQRLSEQDAGNAEARPVSVIVSGLPR